MGIENDPEDPPEDLRPCPECDGEGYLPDAPAEDKHLFTCLLCGGSGVVHHITFPNQEGEA